MGPVLLVCPSGSPLGWESKELRNRPPGKRRLGLPAPHPVLFIALDPILLEEETVIV